MNRTLTSLVKHTVIYMPHHLAIKKRIWQQSRLCWEASPHSIGPSSNNKSLHVGLPPDAKYSARKSLIPSPAFCTCYGRGVEKALFGCTAGVPTDDGDGLCFSAVACRWWTSRCTRLPVDVTFMLFFLTLLYFIALVSLKRVCWQTGNQSWHWWLPFWIPGLKAKPCLATGGFKMEEIYHLHCNNLLQDINHTGVPHISYTKLGLGWGILSNKETNHFKQAELKV